METHTELEALNWWRRTKKTPVSEGDLVAFREWMNVPSHAEAYRRLDAQRSSPRYWLRRSYAERHRRAVTVWLVFIALGILAGLLHAPIPVFLLIGVGFVVTFLVTQVRGTGIDHDPFEG